MTPRKTTWWLGAVVAVASSAVVACGGSVVSAIEQANDSGAPDAGNPDASPAPDAAHFDAASDDAAPPDAAPPWSPLCPAAPPPPGAPCADENLQCEYGNAWWNVACDVVLECQSGQWASDSLGEGICTPGPGSNPSTCPPNFASVPQGGTCTDTSLTCVYSEGTCNCQVPFFGPPIEDAGEAATWQCLPEPGCPSPRPRIGTSCAGTEAQDCTYESCSFAESCANGVWQGEQEACAE
jgi:hypothetical protein